MNFVLNIKTEQQIEAEKAEDRYYAKMVKGELKDICPLSVTLKSGKTIDVWDLTEQDIINLVKANVNEITHMGPKDQSGYNDSFDVIKCWKLKHKKVSADFVSLFFQLRDANVRNKRECVRDMLTPVVNETIEEGSHDAKFMKGLKDDFSPVTEEQIVEAIKEQERQQAKRNEIEKNKTV